MIRALVLIAMLSIASLAFAGEPAGNGSPEIPPAYHIETGLIFVDTHGGMAAAEYREEGLWPVFNGSVVSYPFPSRVHLELEYEGGQDVFADLGYAYSDRVLARMLLRSIHKEMDRVTLVDRDTGNSTPAVNTMDAGAEYSYDMHVMDMSLRFKAPGHPLHLFINTRELSQYSTYQQRFLGGSGTPTVLERVSQSRDVESFTDDFTMGVNGHFGHVETEYSHNQQFYHAYGDRVPSYGYAQSIWNSAIRNAGVYPHNVLPDLHESTDVLRMHTDYTGRVAAALTLMRSERENETSGTTVVYGRANGSLVLRPSERWELSMRYKRLDTDYDTPSTLPIDYLGFTAYNTTTAVTRAGISSRHDTMDIDLIYRPTQLFRAGLSLNVRRIERENAADWNMPDETTYTTAAINAQARLPKRTRVNINLAHMSIDGRSNRAEMAGTSSGDLSISCMPAKRLQGFLKLAYSEGRTNEDGTVSDRTARKFRSFARAGLYPSQGLTFTFGAGYYRTELAQIVKTASTDAPGSYTDAPGSYSDESWLTMASATYKATERLTLDLTGRLTLSKGTLSAANVTASDLSNSHFRETAIGASARQDMGNDWELKGSADYTALENLNEQPDNPLHPDSYATVMLVTLSKRWQ